MAAAPAEPRVQTREELPADVRAALPPMAVSGSTYSSNPAHRMVILNGLVLHEGERASAELVVEQIRAKAVVLGFRGFHVLVPF